MLLSEWSQSLRQAAPLPTDERLSHFGVFGAPAAGHLLLYFCRRLAQPLPVFFRALQLFERSVAGDGERCSCSNGQWRGDGERCSYSNGQ